MRASTGTTRRVFVIGPWAFKLARGVDGRACNRHEAKLFRNEDERRRAMLCPVLWCSRNGNVLIMAAAMPLSDADHAEVRQSGGFPDWDYMPGGEGCPFEFHKAADWGRINGKLIALDYAATAIEVSDAIGPH